MTRDEFKKFMDGVETVLGIQIETTRIYEIWFSELAHIDYKVANTMVDLCYAEEDRMKKSLPLIKKYYSRAVAIAGNKHVEEVHTTEKVACPMCAGKGFVTLNYDPATPYEKTIKCKCPNGKQYSYLAPMEQWHIETMKTSKRSYGNRYYLPQHYRPIGPEHYEAAKQAAYKYVSGLKDKMEGPRKI